MLTRTEVETGLPAWVIVAELVQNSNKFTVMSVWSGSRSSSALPGGLFFMTISWPFVGLVCGSINFFLVGFGGSTFFKLELVQCGRVLFLSFYPAGNPGIPHIFLGRGGKIVFGVSEAGPMFFLFSSPSSTSGMEWKWQDWP